LYVAIYGYVVGLCGVILFLLVNKIVCKVWTRFSPREVWAERGAGFITQPDCMQQFNCIFPTWCFTDKRVIESAI